MDWPPSAHSKIQSLRKFLPLKNAERMKLRTKGTVELEGTHPVSYSRSAPRGARRDSPVVRAMASKFKDQGYTPFGCSQRSQSSASIDRSGGAAAAARFDPLPQLFLREEEDRIRLDWLAGRMTDNAPSVSDTNHHPHNSRSLENFPTSLLFGKVCTVPSCSEDCTRSSSCCRCRLCRRRSSNARRSPRPLRQLWQSVTEAGGDSGGGGGGSRRGKTSARFIAVRLYDPPPPPSSPNAFFRQYHRAASPGPTKARLPAPWQGELAKSNMADKARVLNLLGRARPLPSE